jgi:hypothetical protein
LRSSFVLEVANGWKKYLLLYKGEKMMVKSKDGVL